MRNRLHDFTSASLLCLGEQHRADFLNNQDHAVGGECPEGAVVAVADGASTLKIHGERVPSRAEVGAWLVAEVAVAAGLRALKTGTPDIVGAVAGALHRALAGVWSELGPRAAMGFYSTLLVAVATPTRTLVFGCGDGSWGALLSSDMDEARLRGDLNVLRGRTRVSVFGSRHQPSMQPSMLASAAVSKGETAVRGTLATLLDYGGPPLGVHVATDGILDESAAAALLRGRVLCGSLALSRAVRRPEGCDDFAAAWIGSLSASVAQRREACSEEGRAAP